MKQRNTIAYSDRDPDRTVRFVRWIKTEFHKYVAAASPIVVTIWGVLDRSVWFDHWWLLLFGLFLGVLGVILRPRKPNYSQLQQDYSHLQKRYDKRGEAVERSLETLLEKLAFHSKTDTHQDRVSAYYYHNDTFVMIARYSKNPAQREEGRRVYPVSQGVIGKAWDAPEGVFMRKYPADPERWMADMIEDGLSREQIENLTMRSRSIAAFRVEDSKGSVGALVIESTVQKRIGSETLSLVRESLVYSAIADFIGASSVETPKAVVTGAGEPASLFDDGWKPAANDVAQHTANDAGD